MSVDQPVQLSSPQSEHLDRLGEQRALDGDLDSALGVRRERKPVDPWLALATAYGDLFAVCYGLGERRG